MQDQLFDTDHDTLSQYVRDMADRMGLSSWKIVLDRESPDENSLGGCRVAYGRKIAHIRLAQHQAAEELRNTVVHELLHAHVEPMDWNANNLRTTLGDPMFTVWSSSFLDCLEVAVDAIATAWAQTLPLPVMEEPDAVEG